MELYGTVQKSFLYDDIDVTILEQLIIFSSAYCIEHLFVPLISFCYVYLNYCTRMNLCVIKKLQDN